MSKVLNIIYKVAGYGLAAFIAVAAIIGNPLHIFTALFTFWWFNESKIENGKLIYTK